MRLAVDRIENDIAICQDLETKDMLEISVNVLPSGIHDGSILLKENDTYKLALDDEEERRKKLQDRFNRLKKD